MIAKASDEMENVTADDNNLASVAPSQAARRAMNPPSPRYARLPIFYGWIIVAAAFVTMAIGVNARTAFSLLFPPILDEFGWDRGVVAGVFSFGFFVSALVAPVRRPDGGPQRPAAGRSKPASWSLIAGLCLATLAREAWQFYATLGVLVGIGGNLLGYGVQSVILPNWFVRRRGLAIGIAFSGVGVGSIVLLPWLQIVIARDGWRWACLALALITAVLLIPLNLLLRKRPQDIGLHPDGDAAADERRRGRAAATSSTPRGPRSTGRSRARCARRASGGSRSATSASSMPGTPCRCTRPNI